MGGKYLFKMLNLKIFISKIFFVPGKNIFKNRSREKTFFNSKPSF